MFYFRALYFSSSPKARQDESGFYFIIYSL